MLACARIGAVHSVVFGGFSPDSLADRINDAGARVLITADGGHRRGSSIPLKNNADRALEKTPDIDAVVVVACGTGLARELNVRMQAGRDHWYHTTVPRPYARSRRGGRMRVDGTDRQSNRCVARGASSLGPSAVGAHRPS